jgi:serine/threonine protein kinase
LEFQWHQVHVLQPLGFGSFGKVFLGELNHANCAVKLLVDAKAAAMTSTGLTTTTGADGEVAMATKAQLATEVATMAALNHPNVVQLLGFCMDPPALAVVSVVVSFYIDNTLKFIIF